MVVAGPLETADQTKFLLLFQGLSTAISSDDMSKYAVLPYDYHCPTVQKDLIDRICPLCDLYFASKKNVEIHKKAVHPSVKTTEIKRKTKRVIKKSKNEAMCIIADDLTREEDMEWIPLDEIEIENVTESHETGSDENCIPVITWMDDWLTPEWTVAENND